MNNWTEVKVDSKNKPKSIRKPIERIREVCQASFARLGRAQAEEDEPEAVSLRETKKRQGATGQDDKDTERPETVCLRIKQDKRRCEGQFETDVRSAVGVADRRK